MKIFEFVGKPSGNYGLGGTPVADGDFLLLNSGTTEGDGEAGDNGWSPVFALVNDGERRVLQLTDWVGGEGTKPATGDYVGSTGLTPTIGDAVDLRGQTGADGNDGEDGVSPTLPTDYSPQTGTTLSFALADGKPRKYGFNGTPITGNLTFSITDASELVMIKCLHNSGAEPTVTPPGGVTAILEGGEYVLSVDNILYAICHKNDAGTVTKISYSWTQDQS